MLLTIVMDVLNAIIERASEDVLQQAQLIANSGIGYPFMHMM